MPDSDVVQYVYIIYSHNDQDFVSRLIADLQARGVSVWIDHKDLMPGTPIWEQMINKAIRLAQAVFLIASPSLSQSSYTRDEFDIASTYTRPVYPVWVDGNQWAKSVWMDLWHIPFIDARGTHYSAAVDSLAKFFDDNHSSPTSMPRLELLDEIAKESTIISDDSMRPSADSPAVVQPISPPDKTHQIFLSHSHADTNYDALILTPEYRVWRDLSDQDRSAESTIEQSEYTDDAPLISNPRPMEPPLVDATDPQPVQQNPHAKPSTPPKPSTIVPKTSSGSPSATTVPGSTAGPSDSLANQYGGSGAVAGKANLNQEERRRRAVDESSTNHVSKKLAPGEDFKQAETETSDLLPIGGLASMTAMEDVHFTAFRPEVVPISQWLTLLVYAHADRVRDRIAADADKFADQMGGKPKSVQGKTSAQLERGTELRIVPTCDGVQFNPESITLKWIEDWHRAEFRFQADAALSGTEDVARVAIYVGPLLVGQVKLALSFTTASPLPAPNILSAITGRGKSKARSKMKPVSAKIYEARQIFLSYSHADTNIVLACRDACKRLGFTPLIDIDTLRAGQHWSDELMNMIDRADIFQLFWSERAAQSQYVRQEWEYALQLVQNKTKMPDFIRPTYWEKPPAPIPEPLADIHFDYTPAIG